MSLTTAAPSHTDTELYLSVQQFYARQMQLLDAGEATRWAQTFTEDGVFAANAHPDPVRGRAEIAAAASATTAAMAEKGIQRRHWLGMVHVTREGAAVRARSYALILETPKGGQAGVRLSTTCDDLLVPGPDGEWLVQHREVKRDDLP